MDINEVKNYLETNKDAEDVKTFVAGLNPINLDRVKEFVGKDKDAQGWFDSEKDKHTNKALESWKTNNLPKEIDAEIKKRFPEADPKDVELKKLQAQIEQMQKDSARKELTNKALKTAQEKKIPAELVDYFIGQDEDATNKNLDKFAEILTAHDEEIKKQFAKDNSYVPPKGKGNLSDADKIKEQIRRNMGLK